MSRVPSLFSLGALAALSACRLVAGIEDIQLTSDAGGTDANVALPSVVFTRGNETVDELIVDGPYVYARTFTGILRCPVTGCGSTPETLVTFGVNDTVNDMALAGDSLYYAVSGTSVDTDGGIPVPSNDGTIHRVGKDGKGDTVYKSGLADPMVLGSDAANLYWLDDPSGLGANGAATASRCPLATCITAQPVITNISGSLVTWSDSTFFVRGPDLYLLAADGAAAALYTCPTATPCRNTPKKLATGLADDDDFFSDPQRLFYLTAKGDVGYLDATGKTVLVGGQAAPTSMVADSTFIYFTIPTTGTVLRMPNTGSPATPAPFATQQPSVTGLAQDTGNVYWVIETGSGGSTVMRAAK